MIDEIEEQNEEKLELLTENLKFITIAVYNMKEYLESKIQDKELTEIERLKLEKVIDNMEIYNITSIQLVANMEENL